jgi:hypothetical protein
MRIPFTQYLLPDGRTKAVYFETDEEVGEKAKALLEKGCHFDVEILTTGVVSLTCEKDENLLAIELYENEAGSEKYVKQLVIGAVESLRKRGD